MLTSALPLYRLFLLLKFKIMFIEIKGQLYNLSNVAKIIKYNNDYMIMICYNLFDPTNDDFMLEHINFKDKKEYAEAISKLNFMLVINK